MNRGEKTYLTDELIDTLKEVLSTGVPITYAVTAVKCSYSVVQTWCKEGESGFTAAGVELKPEARAMRQRLKTSIEEGKAAFVINNVRNINEAGKDDWKASAWSLSHAPETREQFSDAGRIRVEVEKRLQVAISVLQRELPPATFERVLMGINEASLEDS